MNSLMNKEIGDINGDGEVGGRVVDDIFGEQILYEVELFLIGFELSQIDGFEFAQLGCQF